MTNPLQLVATCALGLEELLRSELLALGIEPVVTQKGAALFHGGWSEVWRCNWRLRTANRVLVALAEWNAEDGDSLAAGASELIRSSKTWQGLSCRDLFTPRRTFALRATTSASLVRDTRWVALRVKDGLVDAQREAYGKRSSVDREDPDLHLRVWLNRDRASLLLDTSGEPLDRRGYRMETTTAPVRENIAAACVLKSGWDGRGPVVDPMCGSGSLLAEAAWFALGRAPGFLRSKWAFQRLPVYDERAFRVIRDESLPAPGPDVRLYGIDRSAKAIRASRANLQQAQLLNRTELEAGDAFAFDPPPGPGLILVNPPYGDRLTASPEQWKTLGDLLKQKYRGWKAVVLAGGPDRGKHIGLRPSFRLPVKNGPLDARILGFDLY